MNAVNSSSPLSQPSSNSSPTSLTDANSPTSPRRVRRLSGFFKHGSDPDAIVQTIESTASSSPPLSPTGDTSKNSTTSPTSPRKARTKSVIFNHGSDPDAMDQDASSPPLLSPRGSETLRVKSQTRVVASAAASTVSSLFSRDEPSHQTSSSSQPPTTSPRPPLHARRTSRTQIHLPTLKPQPPVHSPAARFLDLLDSLIDKGTSTQTSKSALQTIIYPLESLSAEFFTRQDSRPEFIVVYDLVPELQQVIETYNPSKKETVLFQIQKSISRLVCICEGDEALAPKLLEITEKLLHLQANFAHNEMQLYESDPSSYRLPIKPRSQQGRDVYEKTLTNMAQLCYTKFGMRPISETSLSSSVVCVIGNPIKPLFIFKPCIGETVTVNPTLFPPGEGPFREFYAARHRLKCALCELPLPVDVVAKLPQQSLDISVRSSFLGFLSEFIPNSGSLQYLSQTLPDKLRDAEGDQKKQLQAHIALVERDLKIQTTDMASKIRIWNHERLDQKKMQRMMLEDLWSVNYDLNIGNYLVCAKRSDSGFELSDCLISIDFGHALPSRPLLITDSTDILHPAWMQSQAALAPIESTLKQEFLRRDAFTEMEELQGKIPSMTEDGLVLIALTRHYIKTGILHGYTIAQIAQGFVNNKIHEWMLEMVKTPDGGKNVTYLNLQEFFINQTYLRVFEEKCKTYLTSLPAVSSSSPSLYPTATLQAASESSPSAPPSTRSRSSSNLPDLSGAIQHLTLGPH